MSRRLRSGDFLAPIGWLSWIILLAFIGCHCSRRAPVATPNPMDAFSLEASVGEATSGDQAASEPTRATPGDASPVEASPEDAARVGEAATPSVIANPNLADVCLWSGNTEGIVDGICPRREDGWAWTTEMGMYKSLPGESELPACPLDYEADLAGLDVPGWLMRVDGTLPSIPVEHTTDHYYSQVVATRLDGPAQCTVKLLFTLKQQTVRLAAGTVVRYSHRYTILNLETDAFTTNLLRDENGVLLIGWVSGIRPKVWDKDMWRELTLSFASTPVCQKAGYPDALFLRLTLSNGADTCTLDGSTARCCTFSGLLYEVAADAWHDVPGRYPDNARILVARRDLLVPAP